jgi:hypothetical protein
MLQMNVNLLSLNCNYLIKSCVRPYNILLVSEHEDASPENLKLGRQCVKVCKY